MPEDTFMRPALQRLLMAYRPLYMNGLLRDGRCRLPRLPEMAASSPASVREAAHRPDVRPAPAQLLHLDSRYRSKP
jgi:hypothetical protein